RNALNGMNVLRRSSTVALLLFCLALPTARADERFSTAASGKRTQVCIVHDADATDAFRPRPDHARTMVERGIIGLTGKTNLIDAWRSIVTTQDVVGIKVVSEPGPNSGT